MAEQMANKYYSWGGMSSLSARTAPGGAPTTTTAASRSWAAHEPSWEELAFARDAAGHLAWPPRSYTCTFCRREFRSAQALGGHMNVHRRDRARLRQHLDDDDDQAPPPPPAAAAASSSHISTTIMRMRESRLVISIPAVAATAGMSTTKEAIDYEEEEIIVSAAESSSRKRRRLHHPKEPQFIRPPQLLPSSSKGAIDQHADDATNKVPNKVIITSPSPNSLHLAAAAAAAGRQEVDLELRLGTSPQVA